MTTSSFYSELIQCDFSLLLLRLHQLFLVSCGHSLRTTHQPFGCPATTSTQSVLAVPLPILGQNSSLFCFSLHLSHLTRMDKGLSPSLYLPLWHASSGHNPLLTFFGRNVILARHFSQKKPWQESQNRLLFPSPPNHTL